MSKVFIGSIPTETPEEVVRAQFEQYGAITSFYLRRDLSGPARSWAFITFETREQAMAAIDTLGGGKLMFPGATSPCEVGFARSTQAAVALNGTPAKLFVGSIPQGTTESMLRAEFDKYGLVTEVFMKSDIAVPGRVWAFVTFADQGQAQLAASCTHEKLMFPGSTRACDVSFARNGGPGVGAGISPGGGPAKLFIGCIPAGTTEQTVIEEFQKFGAVTEIFMRSDATDPRKMWALLTYSDKASASLAADMFNEKLMLPGAECPVSVSLAKNPTSSDVTSGIGATQLPVPAAAPVSKVVGAVGAGALQHAFTTPAVQSGPTKVFVGSIPPGTSQQAVVEEFQKYGVIAEVFLKNDATGTESERLWAFVTFTEPSGAAAAVANLNEKIVFPGSFRPLAVSFARSSTPVTGNDALSMLGAPIQAPVLAQPVSSLSCPRKLFVGSIPFGTPKEVVQQEFEKFGPVSDVFIKNDSTDPARMWGFVTYQEACSAAAAVPALNERLVLPGGSRPCAVSFARSSQAQHSMAAASLALAGGAVAGTCKLFLGTIPLGTTEDVLRKEFEKYGQVVDIFLRPDNSDPNRMWGFLTYADPTSAAVAVSALHERLKLPGSVRPLAVSFARSNARQQPGHPPPPPPPPPRPNAPVGDWKTYHTAQGVPYYHNQVSGVTQWERPPDLPHYDVAVGIDGLKAPEQHQLGHYTAQPLGVEQHRYAPY